MKRKINRLIAVLFAALLFTTTIGSDVLTAVAAGDMVTEMTNEATESDTDVVENEFVTDDEFVSEDVVEDNIGGDVEETAEENEEEEADAESEDAEADDLDLQSEDEEYAEELHQEGTTASGIKVTANAAAGVFPNGTTMEVAEVSVSQAIVESVDDQTEADVTSEDMTAIDITFYCDGEVVEPNTEVGNVNVTFENINVETDELQVFHVENEETVVEVENVDVVNGDIEIVADSFSVYIFVNGQYVKKQGTNGVELTGNAYLYERTNSNASCNINRLAYKARSNAKRDITFTVTSNFSEAESKHATEADVTYSISNEDINNYDCYYKDGSTYREITTWRAYYNTKSGKYAIRAYWDYNSDKPSKNCADYVTNENSSNDASAKFFWIYKKALYKVTYKMTDDSRREDYGDKWQGQDYTIVNKPGSWSKPGYVFDGWNTAINGSGTQYKVGDKYTEDKNITLYTQWTQPATITYSGEGVSLQPVTANIGSEITLPTVKLDDYGNYNFLGWSVYGDTTNKKYAAGSKYTVVGDVEFVANWSTNVNVYIATGDSWWPNKANHLQLTAVVDAKLSSGDSYELPEGASVTFDAANTAILNNNGYDLNNISWINYKLWQDLQDVNGDGEQTHFHLNGKVNTVSVTYNTNGATSDTPIQADVVPGTEITLAAAPTKTDYKFAGWYVGDTKAGNAGEKYTVNSNVILTAKWNEKAAGTANITLATGLTYDGTSKNLISSAEASGAITYYVDDKAVTGEPTAINAGSYEVSYSVASTEDNKAITKTSLGKVTVAKATNTLTVNYSDNNLFDSLKNSINLIFGGSNATTEFAISSVFDSDKITVSPTENESLKAEIKNGKLVLTAKNKASNGNVELTLTSKSSDNYDAETKKVLVTVANGTITIDSVNAATDLTYDGSTKTLVTSVTAKDELNEKAEFTYSYKVVKLDENDKEITSSQDYQSKATATDAGKYHVYVRVSQVGYTTADYDQVLTVEIKQAEYDDIQITSSNREYFEANTNTVVATSAKFDAKKATGASVSYVYSTEENGTYTSVVPTAAGTYYAKAVFAASADGNYKQTVSNPVSFTINPAIVRFYLKKANGQYEDCGFANALNQDILGLGEDFETAYAGIKNLHTTETNNDILTGDAANEFVSKYINTAKITDKLGQDASYRIVKVINYTHKDNKGDLHIDFVPVNSATLSISKSQWTYGDESGTLTVTQNQSNYVSQTATYEFKKVGDDTFTSNTMPTAAGKYTVVAHLAAAGTDFPAVDSNTVEFTIEPKTLTLKWTGDETVTYDGQSHSLVAELDGVVNQDRVSVVYSENQTTAPTYTDVNFNTTTEAVDSYAITVSGLTGDDSANYLLSSENRSKNLTINRKSIKVLRWVITEHGNEVDDMDSATAGVQLYYNEDDYPYTIKAVTEVEGLYASLGGATDYHSAVGNYSYKTSGDAKDSKNNKNYNYVVEESSYSFSIVYKTIENTLAFFGFNSKVDGKDVYAPIVESNGTYYIRPNTGAAEAIKYKARVNDGQFKTVSIDGESVDRNYVSNQTQALSYTEGEHVFTYQLKDKDGYCSDILTAKYYVDSTAPTGKITVGKNVFENVINTITFGYFYKNATQFTIEATDNGAGMGTIEYSYDNENWTTYSSAVRLAANWKGTVYARFTDAVTNSAVINSYGLVVYTDSSAINDFEIYRFRTSDWWGDLALNGNSIKKITLDDQELTAETDYHYSSSKSKLKLSGNILSKLTVGDHKVVISYKPLGEEYVSGDEPSTTEFTITVKKAHPTVTLNLSKDTWKYKQTPAEVTTTTTGNNENATFKVYKLVGDEYKKLNDRDGVTAESLKLDELLPGSYKIKVEYAENDDFRHAYVEKTFTVTNQSVVFNILNPNGGYKEFGRGTVADEYYTDEAGLYAWSGYKTGDELDKILEYINVESAELKALDSSITYIASGVVCQDQDEIHVDIIITNKPEISVENWTYDGKDYSQKATWAGSKVFTESEFNFNYSYTGTSRSGIQYTSTTAPVDAGNYAVTAELAYKDNAYANIGASESASYVIDPRTVEFTWSLSNTESNPMNDSNEIYLDGLRHNPKASVANKADCDANMDLYATHWQWDKGQVGKYKASFDSRYLESQFYIVDGSKNRNYNYTMEGAKNASFEWAIKYFETEAVVTASGSDNDTTDGWFNGTVTLSASDSSYVFELPYGEPNQGGFDKWGFNEYDNPNAGYSNGYAKNWTSTKEYAQDGEYTVTYRVKNAQGYIAEPKTVSFKLDQTPATVADIKANGTSVLAKLKTFFFKNAAELGILAEDNLSGVERIEYSLDGQTWKTYGALNPINDRKLQNVSVKVTDKAHNVSEAVVSGGVVVYKDSWVANASYEERTFTRPTSEQLVANLRMNGNTLNYIDYNGYKLVEDQDYTITSEGTVTFKDTFLSDLVKFPYDNKNAYVLNFHMNPAGVELDENSVLVDGDVVVPYFGIYVRRTAGFGTLDITGWTYGQFGADEKNYLDWNSSTNSCETEDMLFTLYDANKQPYSNAKNLGSEAMTDKLSKLIPGSYYVSATFAENDDYYEYTTPLVAFTVTTPAVEFYIRELDGTYTLIDEAVAGSVEAALYNTAAVNTNKGTTDVASLMNYFTIPSEVKKIDEEGFKVTYTKISSHAENGKPTHIHVDFTVAQQDDKKLKINNVTGFTYGQVGFTPELKQYDVNKKRGGAQSVEFGYYGKMADGTAYGSENELMTVMPTNAGQYHVVAKVAPTTYYNGSTLDKKFKIDQKKIGYTFYANDGDDRHTVTLSSGDKNDLIYTTNAYSVYAVLDSADIVNNDEINITYSGQVKFDEVSNAYSRVKIDSLSNKNYKFTTQTYSVRLQYLSTESVLVPAGADKNAEDDWFNGQVTVAADGYTFQLKGENGFAGDFVSSQSYGGAEMNAQYALTYRLMNAEGYVTDAKNVSFKIDSINPETDIKVNGNSVYANILKFFYKDRAVVTLEAEDPAYLGMNGSGVAKVEYQILPDGVDLLLLEDNWEEVQGFANSYTFAVPANAISRVVLRATDAAGNVSRVINTAGMVVYTDAEAVTESLTFTRQSSNDLTFTVKTNGNQVKAAKVGPYEITGDDLLVEYNDEDDTADVTIANPYIIGLLPGQHTVEFFYNALGQEFVEAEANFATPIDESDEVLDEMGLDDDMNGADEVLDNMEVTLFNEAPATTTALINVVRMANGVSIGAFTANPQVDVQDGTAPVAIIGTGAVTVTSSDSSVATGYIANGVLHVVPVSAGSATITITSAQNDDYESATASVAVTVAAAPVESEMTPEEIEAVERYRAYLASLANQPAAQATPVARRAVANANANAAVANAEAAPAETPVAIAEAQTPLAADENTTIDEDNVPKAAEEATCYIHWIIFLLTACYTIFSIGAYMNFKKKLAEQDKE